MIEIEHLRKEYGTVTPLSDISTVIRDGEVVSIIGPSGTGKSTFLRCLNLLEKPTSGRILIGGTDITKKGAPINRIREKIGFVFQSFNLYEHLTVAENIMFAQVHLLKRSRQESYDNAVRLLDSVGLGGRETDYPAMLSGGQKQRVAIARTLAMDPDILLFDEPTSALDPLMVGEVTDVIGDLVDQGKTMLIVTHEMAFARKISDRVLFFADGVIYEEGTPEEIFDHPQKEKTKIFMRNIAVLNCEITRDRADYDSIMTDIKRFVVKNGLDHTNIHKLQLLIEEVMFSFFRVRASAEDRMKAEVKYDNRTERVCCAFYHTLGRSIFEASNDRFSSALIQHTTKNIAEKDADDGCFRRVIECDI